MFDMSMIKNRYVDLHIPIFKMNINCWIDINTCWFWNWKRERIVWNFCLEAREESELTVTYRL